MNQISFCRKQCLGQSSVVSDSELLASGWVSLWESSSFVPCFVPYAFRDISGAVPEWPWPSGFMRKSSKRDSAPRMRFSVLLNSWDNVFVTLRSTSSEIWVIYILRVIVFFSEGKSICFLTVPKNIMYGISYTGYYRQYYKNNINTSELTIVCLVHSFPLFIPFLGGKHICLHAKSLYK